MPRKINTTWDVPENWDPNEFYDYLYSGGMAYCVRPESHRVIDISDEDYTKYLLYLLNFVHNVLKVSNESPFTYEQWIMCGMPDAYIPGLRIEDDTNYLQIEDEKGHKAYIKIDERTADYIARGLISGRFKRCRRSGQSTGSDDNN